MIGLGIGIAKNSAYSNGVGANEAIIIAGQSNALGWQTAMGSLPAELTGDIDGALIYDGSGSVFATLNATDDNNNQYPQQTNAWGMEMYMAQGMLAQGISPYLIKYAKSGSSLGQDVGGPRDDWDPATVGELYDGLVDAINDDVKPYFINNNIDPVWRFVWFQGEQDSSVEVDADLYLTRLESFFTNFKSDTGLSDIEVYICRLRNLRAAGGKAYWEAVRYAQTEYCLATSNTYLKDVMFYDYAVDDLHLDEQGQEDLGTDLANDFQNGLTNPITLFENDFGGTTIEAQLTRPIDPDAVFSQNDKFLCTNDHSGTVTIFSTFLAGEPYVKNKEIWVQANYGFTNDTLLNATNMFGLYFDTNNYCVVWSNNDASAELRIRLRDGGSPTDIATTGVSIFQDYRFYWDPVAGTVDVEYWNSGWTLIHQFIGVTFPATGKARWYFTDSDSITRTGADLVTLQKASCSIRDYSTKYPSQ